MNQNKRVGIRNAKCKTWYLGYINYKKFDLKPGIPGTTKIKYGRINLFYTKADINKSS